MNLSIWTWLTLTLAYNWILIWSMNYWIKIIAFTWCRIARSRWDIFQTDHVFALYSQWPGRPHQIHKLDEVHKQYFFMFYKLNNSQSSKRLLPEIQEIILNNIIYNTLLYGNNGNTPDLPVVVYCIKRINWKQLPEASFFFGRYMNFTKSCGKECVRIFLGAWIYNRAKNIGKI